MSEFPRINCYWDDQEGAEPGWYCEELSESGEVVDRSSLAGCTMDVDFAKDDHEGLIASLSDSYPEHEIYVQPASEGSYTG